MDQVLYPYRKKPEHLTDEEDIQITQICEELKGLNNIIAKDEMLKGYIAKERTKLQDGIAKRHYFESKLSQHERRAIITKKLATRKALELGCKEMRSELLKISKHISELELKVAELETLSREVEGAVQEQTVINSGALVILCKGVQIRQEEKKKRRRIPTSRFSGQ